jgi:hypothetical protein
MYVDPSFSDIFMTFDSCRKSHSPKIHVKIEKLYESSRKADWVWPEPDSSEWLTTKEKLGHL